MSKTKGYDPQTTAQCRTCGEDIRWLLMESTGRRAPMTYIGFVIVAFGQQGSEKPAYKRHECSEEVMKAFRVKRDAELIAEQEKRHKQQLEFDRVGRQQAHARKNRAALEKAYEKYKQECIDNFTCEKCGAPKGKACFNLTDVRRGVTPRHTQAPHNGRGPQWVVPEHLQYKET